jgi:hypothetical protein
MKIIQIIVIIITMIIILNFSSVCKYFYYDCESRSAVSEGQKVGRRSGEENIRT